MHSTLRLFDLKHSSVGTCASASNGRVLTVAARSRVDASGYSRRELARRIHTSVPQLYRLLDPTNTRKSLTQLVSLLHILDCDVDLVVTTRVAPG